MSEGRPKAGARVRMAILCRDGSTVRFDGVVRTEAASDLAWRLWAATGDFRAARAKATLTEGVPPKEAKP